MALSSARLQNHWTWYAIAAMYGPLDFEKPGNLTQVCQDLVCGYQQRRPPTGSSELMLNCIANEGNVRAMASFVKEHLNLKALSDFFPDRNRIFFSFSSEDQLSSAKVALALKAQVAGGIDGTSLDQLDSFAAHLVVILMTDAQMPHPNVSFWYFSAMQLIGFKAGVCSSWKPIQFVNDAYNDFYDTENDKHSCDNDHETRLHAFFNGTGDCNKILRLLRVLYHGNKTTLTNMELERLAQWPFLQGLLVAAIDAAEDDTSTVVGAAPAIQLEETRPRRNRSTAANPAAFVNPASAGPIVSRKRAQSTDHVPRLRMTKAISETFRDNPMTPITFFCVAEEVYLNFLMDQPALQLRSEMQFMFGTVVLLHATLPAIHFAGRIPELITKHYKSYALGAFRLRNTFLVRVLGWVLWMVVDSKSIVFYLPPPALVYEQKIVADNTIDVAAALALPVNFEEAGWTKLDEAEYRENLMTGLCSHIIVHRRSQDGFNETVLVNINAEPDTSTIPTLKQQYATTLNAMFKHEGAFLNTLPVNAFLCASALFSSAQKTEAASYTPKAMKTMIVDHFQALALYSHPVLQVSQLKQEKQAIVQSATQVLRITQHPTVQARMIGLPEAVFHATTKATENLRVALAAGTELEREIDRIFSESPADHNGARSVASTTPSIPQPFLMAAPPSGTHFVPIQEHAAPIPTSFFEDTIPATSSALPLSLSPESGHTFDPHTSFFSDF